MSEDTPRAPVKSLNVLPHSGKLDQMRADAGASTNQPAPAPKKDRPIQPHTNRISASPAALKSERQLALEREVIRALMTVYDPEIPIDIYQLGLVYDIDIDADNNVHVRMTLTAPGCPVAGTLPPAVEQKINAIEGVNSATVELVWEPQWTKDMMSEAAQLQLGLL